MHSADLLFQHRIVCIVPRFGKIVNHQGYVVT
jgi:hypothetical protein